MVFGGKKQCFIRDSRVTSRFSAPLACHPTKKPQSPGCKLWLACEDGGRQEECSAFDLPLDHETDVAHCGSNHRNVQWRVEGSLHMNGSDRKAVTTCAPLAQEPQMQMGLRGKDIPHQRVHIATHEGMEQNGMRAIENGALLARCLMRDI